jgi:predicted nuclease with RNAse H fold
VTLVCGVDVGSFTTPAHLAWLEGDSYELDAYQPTSRRPLPPGSEPAIYAFDAPQGLPAEGRRRRESDRAANTPTRILPANRMEVAKMRAYGPFVAAGVSIFWEAQYRGLGCVPGLRGSGPVLLETYPRFVVRRLWPELRPIPSKRRAPRSYIAEIWRRVRELGLDGPEPRTHDQLDALLCALAGRSWIRQEAVEVGEPPHVDQRAGVLREGVIVAPRETAASGCRRRT